MNATMNRYEKAARLNVDGKIKPVAEARSFLVNSNKPDSHERYLVTILPTGFSTGTGMAPPRYSCTCFWGRAYEKGVTVSDSSGAPLTWRPKEECSHVLGVRAFVKLEQGPVDPFLRFEGEE